MVALDKQFDHHHGTKPRSCGRWRDESWQAGKSAERRTADILYARRPRDTSNSSNTSCANERNYCGYRFDSETQLYYVRNRTYNPVLGRWIQRDPIGFKDGANLYGYVESGPVGAVDPTGLATPATQPGAQRNQYIANPKSFDLIISLIPLNAPARTKSGDEGGGTTIVALKDLAARDGVPFKVASNTFELVADIKAAAVAKGANAKSSKSVPVKVLIVNHGNASDGPGFGYGGTHWTPLFPDWNTQGGTATDPDLNNQCIGKPQNIHFVLWALRGLIASAVFTGCSMAATHEDKVLTQDLANLLQAGTITDFTANTEQTVTDSGLVITPGEKVVGRFAFTVQGGTVKK